MLHHNTIKDIWKIKNLEKLFRKNKTSPLLKTPEKDFHAITQPHEIPWSAIATWFVTIYGYVMTILYQSQ